jgi:hypothetical protein
MSKLTEARDAAAQAFAEAITAVRNYAKDQSTEAVELASSRACCREIAGITCERLLTAAGSAREEARLALVASLISKTNAFNVANAACATAKTSAVSTMEALYGSVGIDFAQRHQSVNEVAANAAALRLLEEKGQIEDDLNKIQAHQDNGTGMIPSAGRLAAMESTSAAYYASAFLAAAMAGTLVD